MSNAAMIEIARRLLISIDDNRTGAIRSELPPSDVTRLWFKPSEKKLFAFDTESDAWTEVNPDNVYVCIANTPGNFLRRDESGCLYAIISASEDNLLTIDEFGDPILDKLKMKPVIRQNLSINTSGSGAATLSVTFSDFEDDEAVITVAFRSDPGANGRWWVTSQTATTAELSFAGYANSTAYSINVGIHRTDF